MTMRQRMTIGIGLSVLAAAVALWSPTCCADEKKGTKPMIYELRTYTTAAGRLPALHQRFRDHTLRLFEKHGITNVIYWTPTNKKNTLVYLIAHQSPQDAEKSWATFRDDPQWQKVFKESRQDGKIVTKVDRQYLAPTDYSLVKSDGLKSLVKEPGLVYELRTYTTNPGKLPNLNARFRDHTLALFKKHGIRNVLYTTPTDGKLAENTLVYVIAHKSREAANNSWDTFRNDPEWKRVARESQIEGQILMPRGVKRQFLVPTDYSPMK